MQTLGTGLRNENSDAKEDAQIDLYFTFEFRNCLVRPRLKNVFRLNM